MAPIDFTLDNVTALNAPLVYITFFGVMLLLHWLQHQSMKQQSAQALVAIEEKHRDNIKQIQDSMLHGMAQLKMKIADNPPPEVPTSCELDRLVTKMMSLEAEQKAQVVSSRSFKEDQKRHRVVIENFQQKMLEAAAYQSQLHALIHALGGSQHHQASKIEILEHELRNSKVAKIKEQCKHYVAAHAQAVKINALETQVRDSIDKEDEIRETAVSKVAVRCGKIERNMRSGYVKFTELLNNHKTLSADLASHINEFNALTHSFDIAKDDLISVWASKFGISTDQAGLDLADSNRRDGFENSLVGAMGIMISYIA